MGREGVKVGEVEGGEEGGSTIEVSMAAVEEDSIKEEEDSMAVVEEGLIKEEEDSMAVEGEDSTIGGLMAVAEEALHNITTLAIKIRGENPLMFQLMEDNGVNN